MYSVGTLAAILQLVKLPDGTLKVLVEGKKRAKVTQLVDDTAYMSVEVEEVNEDQNKTRSRSVDEIIRQAFESYVKLNKRIPPEMLMTVQSIETPARLSDTLVAQLNLKLEEKQDLRWRAPRD